MMNSKKNILLLGIALMVSSTIMAVPAKPGKRIVTQADGTKIEIFAHGDECYHYYTLADGTTMIHNEDGSWSKQEETGSLKANAWKQARQIRRQKGEAKPTIKKKGLVILVEFADKKFATGNTLQAFDSLLNSETYNYDKATGSAKKYFIDQSDSAYIPEFHVVGPISLPNKMAYYGGNGNNGDKYLADFVIHTCSIASAQGFCDFSSYDEDEDGEVDFVYMIYAGYGEADSGEENTIWPHNWALSSALSYGYTHSSSKYPSSYTLMLNGKIIENYACSNELAYDNDMRNGIATFCHEFSHVLGLPDYYDTSDNYYSNDDYTPGSWSLMDYGTYNNDGRTPPNYSIYDKYYMGWLTPTILNRAENVTLEANGRSGRMITPSGKSVKYNSSSTIYYLENRQKKGWDKYIPGHGLVIWKVSYNYDAWYYNEVNNTYKKPKYSLLAADDDYTGGDSGDSYPGSKSVTSVTPITNYPLTDITETQNIIRFKFMGGKDTGCDNYQYTFTSKVNPGKQTLGERDWTVAIQDSTYLTFNSTKGATYGSSNYPAQSVSFSTTPDSNCYINSIIVEASMANGGDANMEVLINNVSIGSTPLSSTSTSYSFTPNTIQKGTIQIRLTNSTKAMYIKAINIVFGEPQKPVSVTGISMTQQTANIYVGGTIRLTATVHPADATNKQITWHTASSTLATVDQNGLVTGIRAGTVMITATSKDGNYKAKCSVTISHVSTDVVTMPNENITLSVANKTLHVNGITENTNITILNLSGQLVSQQIYPGDCSIKLAEGMYIVHIKTSNATETRKIIVF